jgi:TonB family protein
MNLTTVSVKGLWLSTTLLLACATTMSNATASKNQQQPITTIVYPAVWKIEGPNQLNALSQRVNHVGEAKFSFVVTTTGWVDDIKQDYVYPLNADVGLIEYTLRKAHLARVFKNGKPIDSHQTYTFFFGGTSDLRYWRETCKNEGIRNNPPPGSGISPVTPKFCTRVKYPEFLVYRFLLRLAHSACSEASPGHCTKGTVTVNFKLTGDGHPTDVTVIKSTAGDMFDLAAKAAIQNWYFVPYAGRPLNNHVNYAITIAFQ